MIYITGDTHGEVGRFSEAGMSGESQWGAEDKLIVCGDFGFIWHNQRDRVGFRYDRERLNDLAARPYEILFVDGNHENFPELERYPVEERYGAPVHRIRDNIFHLMRGYVYTIEGKRFFAFGGAGSVDRGLRTEGYSWWPAELPTEEEYERGRRSLAAVDHRVDYILTHTPANSLVDALRHKLSFFEQAGLKQDHADWPLRDYLQTEVYQKVPYRHWFFGHWHKDLELEEERATALFGQVILLKD